MELIPFLIFAFIAFNIFKGFSKSPSKPNAKPKDLRQRLHAELQKAASLQKETPQNSRYRDSTPTQRGRESLQRKNQSPWGDNGAVSPGARVAAQYLQSQSKTRKVSEDTPEQRGRRGRNRDQNRQRTEGWGERGDSGFLSGRNFFILLVIGGGVLYALSQMPPA